MDVRIRWIDTDSNSDRIVRAWHGVMMANVVPFMIHAYPHGLVVVNALSLCCCAKIMGWVGSHGCDCSHCGQLTPLADDRVLDFTGGAFHRESLFMEALDYWRLDTLRAEIVRDETRSVIARLKPERQDTIPSPRARRRAQQKSTAQVAREWATQMGWEPSPSG